MPRTISASHCDNLSPALSPSVQREVNAAICSPGGATNLASEAWVGSPQKHIFLMMHMGYTTISAEF